MGSARRPEVEAGMRERQHPQSEPAVAGSGARRRAGYRGGGRRATSDGSAGAAARSRVRTSESAVGRSHPRPRRRGRRRDPVRVRAMSALDPGALGEHRVAALVDAPEVGRDDVGRLADPVRAHLAPPMGRRTEHARPRTPRSSSTHRRSARANGEAAGPASTAVPELVDRVVGWDPSLARRSSVACCDGVPAQKNERRIGSHPASPACASGGAERPDRRDLARLGGDRIVRAEDSGSASTPTGA